MFFCVPPSCCWDGGENTGGALKENIGVFFCVSYTVPTVQAFRLESLHRLLLWLENDESEMRRFSLSMLHLCQTQEEGDLILKKNETALPSCRATERNREIQHVNSSQQQIYRNDVFVSPFFAFSGSSLRKKKKKKPQQNIRVCPTPVFSFFFEILWLNNLALDKYCSEL